MKDGFSENFTFFQIHKIIGFAPTILQLVMSNDLEMPVRQAGTCGIHVSYNFTKNYSN